MSYRMPPAVVALLATVLVFLFAACSGDTYEGEEGVCNNIRPPPLLKLR